MAFAYFDVEVTNELNGQTMNFEYQVDLYDYDDEDVKDYANSIEEDPHNLIQEILGWISVTPRLSHLDMES